MNCFVFLRFSGPAAALIKVHEDLARCFLGGPEDAGVLQESDEAILGAVTGELQETARVPGATAIYQGLPVAVLHGAAQRRPPGAGRRNRRAHGSDPKPASLGQCVSGHRHPRLHPYGQAGCRRGY